MPNSFLLLSGGGYLLLSGGGRIILERDVTPPTPTPPSDTSIHTLGAGVSFKELRQRKARQRLETNLDIKLEIPVKGSIVKPLEIKMTGIGTIVKPYEIKVRVKGKLYKLLQVGPVHVKIGFFKRLFVSTKVTGKANFKKAANTVINTLMEYLRMEDEDDD